MFCFRFRVKQFYIIKDKFITLYYWDESIFCHKSKLPFNPASAFNRIYCFKFVLLKVYSTAVLRVTLPLTILTWKPAQQKFWLFAMKLVVSNARTYLKLPLPIIPSSLVLCDLKQWNLSETEHGLNLNMPLLDNYSCPQIVGQTPM